MTTDGYVYGWGRNQYGEVGNGSTNDTVTSANNQTISNNNSNTVNIIRYASTVNTPMLTGGRAADLMEITTGTVAAATAAADADAMTEDYILNNPASDKRGKAVSYAPDSANGALPVWVELTSSQSLTVDATAVTQEHYSGFNLGETVTTTGSLADGGTKSHEDLSEYLYWFSSNESIVTVSSSADGKSVTITPVRTAQAQYGTAVIYAVDVRTGNRGAFAVTVYPEGPNTDSVAIVSNAAVYAGDGISFAIQRNGTVWAWGDNAAGLLGVDAAASVATPVTAFTWKYYTAAELNDLASGETAPGFYTRLKELSGGSGAVVITGLSQIGQALTSITLPAQVDKADYDTLFTSGSKPTAESIKVLGVESASTDGVAFSGGVFTKLTFSENIRAIADGTFAGCTELIDVDWAVGEVADETTVYVTEAAFTGTDIKNLTADASLSGKIPDVFGENVNYIYTTADDSVAQTNTAYYNTPMQVLGVGGAGLLGDISTTYNDAIVAIAVSEQVVSKGYYHTMALSAYGDVFAWGYNAYGQLGTGTTANSAYPVRVLAGDSPFWYTFDSATNTRHEQSGEGERYLTGVVQIAVGESHSLALLKDGTVLCWGNTSLGQGGDSLTSTGSTNRVPQLVRVGVSVGRLTGGDYDSRYLSHIVSISVSGNTNAALRSDGTLYMWGESDDRKASNTSTLYKRYPFPVYETMTGLTTKASDDDRDNYLTNAPDTLKNLVWADVGGTFTLGLSGETAVENGAVVAKGAQIYAWGANTYGQLGNGTTESNGLPVKVSSVSLDENLDKPAGYLDGVVAVSAGGEFAMLMDDEGRVYAWGRNDVGQLGIENTGGGTATTIQQVLTPTPVIRGDDDYGTAAQYPNLYATQGISAGSTHGMAVNWEGFALAWGENTTAQLGDFTTRQSNRPLKVGTEEYRALEPTHTWLYRKDSTQPIEYIENSLNEPPLSITMWYGDRYVLSEDFMNAVRYKGFNLYSDTELSTDPRNVTFTSTDTSIATVESQGDGTWAVKPASPDTYGRVIIYFSGQDAAGVTYTGAVLITVLPFEEAVAVPMVASGRDFTLALKTDGTVWAWGYNQYGQLGDGAAFETSGVRNDATQISKSNVVQVQFPEGVKISYIAAGGYHSLAVTTEGYVYAWGYNAYGQLGNASTANSAVPVLVHGLNNAGTGSVNRLEDIIQVAAGDHFSMALSNTGIVYTWGRNNYGQLGDNTAQSKGYPVRLRGYNGGGYMNNVMAIAAGDSHALVLRNDGSAYAWGLNTSGQLGLGTVDTNSTRIMPGRVVTADGSRLTNVVSVAAGAAHTLAQIRDNTLYAWGRGTEGQLGTGSTAAVNRIPAQVLTGEQGDQSGLISHIVSITAGGNQSAALTATDGDGKNQIYVWGANGNGQLGTGGSANASTPVLSSFSDADGAYTAADTYFDNFTQITTSLSAGQTHTAILGADGYVYSTGSNGYGQLGNGTYTDSRIPVRTGAREDSILIYDETGSDSATVTTLSNTPIFYGGEGLTVDVADIYRKDYKGFNLYTTWDSEKTDLAAAHFTAEALDTHLVKVTDNGNGTYTISAVQADRFGTTTVRFQYTDPNTGKVDTLLMMVSVRDANDTAVTVAEAAAGGAHSAVLKPDGTVWTWGYNANGQLGDGTLVSKAYPVRVLEGAVAIAAGDQHTLALKSDGTVWAWGSNAYGQLGDGTVTRRSAPVQVKTGEQAGESYLHDIVAIAAGDHFSLALDKDGCVYAWGDNSFGQLGDGSNA